MPHECKLKRVSRFKNWTLHSNSKTLHSNSKTLHVSSKNPKNFTETPKNQAYKVRELGDAGSEESVFELSQPIESVFSEDLVVFGRETCDKCTDTVVPPRREKAQTHQRVSGLDEVVKKEKFNFAKSSYI